MVPTNRIKPVRIFRKCCNDNEWVDSGLSLYVMCDALWGESRPEWTIESTT